MAATGGNEFVTPSGKAGCWPKFVQVVTWRFPDVSGNAGFCCSVRSSLQASQEQRDIRAEAPFLGI
jgi:hypothetical protein